MEWDIESSIAFLPEDIRDLFREHADFMYADLKNNRLIVELAPAPEPKYSGHMIRTVDSQNPEWYSYLYRTQAGLKRIRSLKALDRIRNVEDPQFREFPESPIPRRNTYVTLYREVIFERMSFGYEESGLYVPPEPKIQEYFGVEGIEKELDHPF